MAKPKLIVFDLDYTLWPFWVDTHVDPPFYIEKGKVFDMRKREVKPYPEVPAVLERLHKDGYQMAVASRTSEIQGANQLVDLFGWKKYFTYTEIYPGTKIKHFQRFKAASGFDLKEMLFFDDEIRNKHDLDPLGVTCIVVPETGVTMKLLEKGLAAFKSRGN